MARFDLGLTMDEFWELTPGMFQALCKRRNIAIKYDRYANALTASAVYNANRSSEESPVVYPFDFIRDEESAKRLEKIREGKRYIRKVIGGLPMTTPRSKFLEIRRKAIADLTTSKFEDAEALFDSVWPHLKPTEEESNS
jgi:hypothetical protein